MVFGYGRWAQVRKEANLMERSLADVATVGRALVATMLILESRNMGDVSCLIWRAMQWFRGWLEITRSLLLSEGMMGVRESHDAVVV